MLKTKVSEPIGSLTGERAYRVRCSQRQRTNALNSRTMSKSIGFLKRRNLRTVCTKALVAQVATSTKVNRPKGQVTKSQLKKGEGIPSPWAQYVALASSVEKPSTSTRHLEEFEQRKLAPLHPLAGKGDGMDRVTSPNKLVTENCHPQRLMRKKRGMATVINSPDRVPP